MSQYRELAPANLHYDSSAKRYVATPEFTPLYLALNADRYLAQLRASSQGTIGLGETWIGTPPETQTVPVPARRVDPLLFRDLLAVMREGASIEVLYQSMSPNRPEAIWRRVTPHAFASDGLRWHVRGYCHLDGSFKDFILSRWRGLRRKEPAGADVTADRDWRETFTVELTPNPALSSAQRDAVAWEYGMSERASSLSVRKALLYYLKKRLRLDVITDSPAETPVVVANREAFEEALQSASGRVLKGA